MNIRALRNKVVLEETDRKEVTDGGIYLPETVRDTHEYIVVSCGSGIVNADGSITPLEVKVGDKVIILNHHNGRRVSSNGKDYLIVSEHEIIAVID